MRRPFRFFRYGIDQEVLSLIREISNEAFRQTAA
jgi:hypothetical protein